MKTKNIPIEFDYQGKHYKGFLDEVSGSGTHIGCSWHLCLYRGKHLYYNGHLTYHEKSGFRFTSQTGKFEDLTEFFGEYIMLWYE